MSSTGREASARGRRAAKACSFCRLRKVRTDKQRRVFESLLTDNSSAATASHRGAQTASSTAKTVSTTTYQSGHDRPLRGLRLSRRKTNGCRKHFVAHRRPVRAGHQHETRRENSRETDHGTRHPGTRRGHATVARRDKAQHPPSRLHDRPSPSNATTMTCPTTRTMGPWSQSLCPEHRCSRRRLA